MSEPRDVGAAPRLHDRIVPKRRVAARLELASGERIAGQLYVAIHGPGDRPERVADRLNDLGEHYLPVAVDEHHLLVQKSKIVAVRLGREHLAEADLATARTGLNVRVVLTTGQKLEGDLHVAPAPSGSRALDYLNELRPRFIPLVDDGLTLINADYVVAVEELHPWSRGRDPGDGPPTNLGSTPSS